MKLSDFDALSFDCYGTLIDWEAGLLAALKPWFGENGVDMLDDEILAAFGQEEHLIEDLYPDAPYPVILAKCHKALGRRFGIPSSEPEREKFGASVKDWPAFPDSAEALQYLKEHFRLFILSNIDRASFAQSNKKLGVDFDGVYTAEDIGSYKPDLRNFHYLLQELEAHHGISPGKVLHVAQSLYHDHVPAKNLGLASAWIDRRAGKPGGGATVIPDPLPAFDFRFETLGDLAEAHRQEST